MDAEVLYASPHLWDAIKQVEDTELRLECARAYNDWISDFCSYNPDRLIGIGKLPTSSIEDARKELVRIVEDPVLRGAVIDAWPSVAGDRPTRHSTRSGTWPTRPEYR